MSKRIKLDDMMTQKRVSCVLVTTPGSQPPCLIDWTRHIITVIASSRGIELRDTRLGTQFLRVPPQESIQTCKSPKKTTRINSCWDSPDESSWFQT